MDELKKARDIIDTSGNSFHCKILNYLKEKGWSVLISPYYNDNFSDKPREIDLIAEKAFPVNINNHVNHRVGDINIRLFVECKYIPKTSVIWFHDKDKNKVERLVTNEIPRLKNNIYMKEHHYISSGDKVAKLFSTENHKDVESEPIYKALNQSLNAMIYYRSLPSIILSPDKNFQARILNYPVIVCNSFNNFFGVDIDSTQEPVKVNDNFQLEVNYAYMDADKKYKNEYFLIDVLAYEKIDLFLEILQKEVNMMQGFVGN